MHYDTSTLHLFYIPKSKPLGRSSLVLNNEDVFDELELKIELSVESRNK